MKRACLLVARIVMFGCQPPTMAAKHTLKPALPIPPSNGWTRPRLGDIVLTMMLPEGWQAATLSEKRQPSGGPKSFSDAVLGDWSERDTGFMAMGSGDPSGKPDAFYMVIATRSLKDPGTKVDADIADMAYGLKRAGMSL